MFWHYNLVTPVFVFRILKYCSKYSKRAGLETVHLGIKNRASWTLIVHLGAKSWSKKWRNEMKKSWSWSKKWRNEMKKWRGKERQVCYSILAIHLLCNNEMILVLYLCNICAWILLTKLSQIGCADIRQPSNLRFAASWNINRYIQNGSYGDSASWD